MSARLRHPSAHAGPTQEWLAREIATAARAAIAHIAADLRVSLVSERVRSRRVNAIVIAVGPLALRIAPVQSRPLHPREVQAICAIGALLDRLADSASQRERLRVLASRDDLTGLVNARYLRKHLDDEIARAQRHGRRFAVTLFDSDSLKRLNDTFGHLEGDHHLRHVARTLSSAYRRSDVIGRLGGDEFVVIQPETRADAAELAARRTADRFNCEPHRTATDALVPVRLSHGSAGFPDHGRSATELLAAADRMMYADKRTARVVFPGAIAV